MTRRRRALFVCACKKKKKERAGGGVKRKGRRAGVGGRERARERDLTSALLEMGFLWMGELGEGYKTHKESFSVCCRQLTVCACVLNFQ